MRNQGKKLIVAIIPFLMLGGCEANEGSKSNVFIEETGKIVSEITTNVISDNVADFFKSISANKPP